MERHFDIQLDKLKTRIIKMCSLVGEQVEFALKAITDENLELANLVIERDKKVDKYDLKIDKICQRIFALNQPVAMDLRLIMSSLTINSNLERIGDIAVNLAEGVQLLKKKPNFYNRTRFEEMAMLATEMINNAIDAFIDGDAKLAEKVVLSDSKVDKLNAENHRLLIEIMKENAENIEPAVHLLVMSRQLERLGDHATNIAEDVYFIFEAQTLKHNYERFLLSGDDEDEETD